MDSQFLVVKEGRARLIMAEIERLELEDQHKHSVAILADFSPTEAIVDRMRF